MRGREELPLFSEDFGDLYVWIKVECNPAKWMRRGRYVMEQHLGRKLESYEYIHHIDENKHNDNIENLELVTGKLHARLHGSTCLSNK